MAVPEQTPYIEYTGNGSTKNFSLTFDCEDAAHLIVKLNDSPAVTGWVLQNDSVVFTVAPAAGTNVSIQRNTPLSRTASYGQYDNSFRPPAINKDFDKIWLKLQELKVADWLLGQGIASEAVSRIAADVYWDQVSQARDNDLKKYVNNILAGVTGQPIFEIPDSFIDVKQPYPGAVVRNQRDKNSDTINVRDFGAKGDGVTNDTLAINAAINAGVTYFPAGDYKITDHMLILQTASFTAPVGKARLVYHNYPIILGVLHEYQAILVPEMLPSLTLAADYVNAKSYAGNGFVSVSIIEGENDAVHGTDAKPLQQILVSVADGHRRVEFCGRNSDRHLTVLRFDATGNKSGFMCQWGNGIHKIANMIIRGVGAWVSHGVWNNESFGSGIFADANSTITFVDNVSVQYFYYSYHARNSSVITCLPGCEGREAGDVAFFAYGNATLIANKCIAHYSAHFAPGLGGGFCGEMNSQVRCEESFSAHHNTHGFMVLTGSSMWCQASTAEWNTRNGFTVVNGMMVAEYGILPNTRCIARDNGDNGFEAFGSGSFLACNSAKAFNNGKHGFKASTGGSIEITVTEAYNNGQEGYHATNGGMMVGDAAYAHDNNYCGFYAGKKSQIITANATARNNKKIGFLSEKLSMIEALNSLSEGNTDGARSPTDNNPNNFGAYILT